MDIQRRRLVSLIEFSQQSARMRGKPAATVSAHGLFSLHEHEIQGLPGIRINDSGPECEDEIWLIVDRLHETPPPNIGSAMLVPWVNVTVTPTEEPRLREATDGASLIAAGTHSSSADASEQSKPLVAPESTVLLTEYDNSALVRAQFASYVDSKWRPWAAEENLRRKTIRLYAQLFTLNQQLEGSIVESQLELVWGVGLGIWNSNGSSVSYPLLGRLVELSLDPDTARVQIRPRDVDPRIEVDWYASVDNPGVVELERASKELFRNATTTFSPFDRGTYESLLRTAATNLDANGIYWPDEALAGDRALPRPDDKLKVTDSWVLMARPRTNNVYVQDLDKLRQRAEETDSYPPALTAVLTDPDTDNPTVVLPEFRGVSTTSDPQDSASGKKVRDIYFPKPYNDEQFRIAQLLEVSDGVVVQGPPGTGKTHTIANVICHYLAQGKRVLVTSMKEPALREVQEKLPEEIRPLAISLLSSEQEGMKQFEHAIQRIASEVQGFDRSSTARAITHLTETIDALHGKLAGIDYKIADWAKRNLVKITLDAEEIVPQDAARELVESEGQFEWIPDNLGITPEFAPIFGDSDVLRLREARRELRQDIDYLNTQLPQLVEFPDSKTLLEVHQDLSQFEKLQSAIERGEVPSLADSTMETLEVAISLLADVERLLHLRDHVAQVNRHWPVAMRERLWGGGVSDLMSILESVGAELLAAVDKRGAFIERPVTIPAGIELDPEIVQAVNNLAEGKSPFGIKGWLGRTAQKQHLNSIRVLGNPPADGVSWKHVAEYLALLKYRRELAFRWNSIAAELQISQVSTDGSESSIALAGQEFAIYLKVKDAVSVEAKLSADAIRVFPNWPHARTVGYNHQRLAEFETALRHHITKNRLANVWAAKERIQKALDGRSGRVIIGIRRFLSSSLGSPEIDDAKMQYEWSALMAELSRVLGLGTHLTVVREVCHRIADAGAPLYATLLSQPLEGTIDVPLPDNWRRAWRLRRLATYLDSIDAKGELKRLAKVRDDLTADLSRAYRDIVVMRTWLKLAENASPSVRAALQAYLNAIQNIGKGTGKRAAYLRQNARAAASKANPAVPCWIMPHYRVSGACPRVS